MSNREQAKADVLQGTLDLMILQTLATLASLHGYAIAARLEQVSVYPGLMRLEQRRFVLNRASPIRIGKHASTSSLLLDGVDLPLRRRNGVAWCPSCTRSLRRLEIGGVCGHVA
jgi:hypothetical protein